MGFRRPRSEVSGTIPPEPPTYVRSLTRSGSHFSCEQVWSKQPRNMCCGPSSAHSPLTFGSTYTRHPESPEILVVKKPHREVRIRDEKTDYYSVSAMRLHSAPHPIASVHTTMPRGLDVAHFWPTTLSSSVRLRAFCSEATTFDSEENRFAPHSLQFCKVHSQANSMQRITFMSRRRKEMLHQGAEGICD